MHSNKSSLVLVDRRALHRERIRLRLDTIYDVTDFALLTDALRHCRRFRPGAMIICEDQARGEDFFFLRSMRLEPAFNTLPIIIILAEESIIQSTRALAAGADACLAKPYLPAKLVTAIAAAMTKGFERKWDELPASHAAALKNSRRIFNAIIASDQPIAYADINAACAPLVAATNSSAVGSLLSAVREHDDYTYAHSLRVGVFLSVFGRNIGLPAPELSVLTAGGLLLDIGKSTIPALLLNKSGHLTDAETRIMQGHVAATMEMLARSPDIPEGVRVIAGQHHENLDGSGYPHALPGSQLNELARMAAIADVFCALTDKRIYRESLSSEEAFALMGKEMIFKLDMRLLRCFRQILYDTHIVEALAAAAATRFAIQNV